jgi:hypothetical protein
MTTLPPETVQRIRDMRKSGELWKDIQKALGHKYHTIRCAIDEEYRQRRRLAERERKKQLNIGHVQYVVDRCRPAPELVEQRRAWMDLEDTRDLTGVLMGDPRPSQSTLCQRSGGGK